MERVPAAASEATPQPAGGRLRRVELFSILGFWCFFAMLTAANRLLDPRGPGFPTRLSSPPVAMAFVESMLWAALTPFIFWLAAHRGVERSSRLPKVLLLLGVGIVVALLVDLATDFARLHWLGMPQRPSMGVFPYRNVTRLWFVNDLLVYVAILAAGFAREYFQRYRLRQEETVRLQAHTAQLQAQLAEARLEALRMQINPHFLFNTLHAISSLVERDPRGVRRMIARLSELLRYTLNGTGEQEVTLEQELEFLRRYLEIMEVRFQGTLEVDLHVEPALLGALVPNLILQPLVENAVKHGVSNKVGTGRIEVGARREGARLILSVCDDGPGMDPGRLPLAGEGVGLRNVRARLEELYGEDQTLSFRPGRQGGLVAEIDVPFHTASDLHTSALVATSAGAAHGF